jgi:hypothetical protein
MPFRERLQVSESKPYFCVSSAKSRLKASADSWVGTPFHANGMVKGPNGGVNCVGLIYAMSVEIGLIEEGEVYMPSEIPMHWHEHNEMSLLGDWFRSPQVRDHIKRIDLEDGLMTGDLLALKIKKCEHHLCQMIDEDHLIHCHRKKGVMVTSLEDVKQFLGTGIYRIYK